ncbi:hypothetical protein O3M35_002745 [Rhynocoris fuscipes]|uniref:Bromo domain-containing protein n=1 Tax=Rhynocoris fuscipes TaxID=488301 RepID=A0AAW1CQF1_9HEMI
MDEGFEEGYPPTEDNDVPEQKKKRKVEVYQTLPSSSTIGFDPEVVEELQAAYQILQTIMKISKIEAFLVKPNSDLYGMSSYYNIIKKPMWLNEVHRKLMDREYSGIKEVIADIKLLLENCYRFWGPSHKFTKKGLHIEHKLEQKLEELPKTLRSKCIETDEPSIVVVKTENAEDGTIVETNNEISEINNFETESDLYSNYKGFQSKILTKVLNDNSDEASEEDLEEQKKQEQVMLSWIKEHLVSEETEYLIKHTCQLAEIGQFLRLTAGVLNVEELTQYEVERMLLMPKESTSLATLMTSMLSPAMMRSNLDVTPVMPYEIWTSKLKKKIESWLKVYYKTDMVQAFSITGIDPYFWDVISLVNPLEEKPFHEIRFYERVWILKSLCDNLAHTNKSIQDVFLDETKSANEFRAIDFGKGPAGSYYFGLEFFPEIRVYKQQKVLNKVWVGVNSVENATVKLLRSNLVDKWNEEEKKVEFLPNSKYFSIEADNVDSLISLIETLQNKGFKQLTENLEIYLNEAKKHKHRLEGLEALYRQWHEYKNRAPEYFTNLLNLWLSTENPEYPKKDEEEEESIVLGKRRITINKTNNIFEQSLDSTDEFNSEEFYESDESDVSDWEREKGFSKQKSKRKKNVNNNSGPAVSKRKNNRKSDEIEMVVNNEDIERNDININNNKTWNNVVTKPLSDSDILNVIPFVEVKKESEDDIVVISSDEDDATTPVPRPIVIPAPPQQQPMPVQVPPPPAAVAPLHVPPVPAPIQVAPAPRVPSPEVAAVSQVTPISSPVSRRSAAPLAAAQSGAAMISSSVVLFKVAQTKSPQPPPPPPEPIRMPQPMIDNTEVVMPKPIPEIVRTPRKRPVPMPIQEPPPPPHMNNLHNNSLRTPPKQPAATTWMQNVYQSTSTPIPRNRSPMAASLTPRQRTPTTPRMMMTPPSGRMMMGRSNMNNMMSPMNNNNMRGASTTSRIQRNLFPQSPSAINKNTVPSIEGKLFVGQKSDGSYGYYVRLPDGGVINVTRDDIEMLRQKNNGNVPSVVKVPLNRSGGGARILF